MPTIDLAGQRPRTKLAGVAPRLVKVTNPGADYDTYVIDPRRKPLRDFYFALLRLSWPATLSAIASGVIAVNALFALGYLASGGVAHARPGSFADAFYFSVQTMGTIGYGAMYPETTEANLLVVAESIASLILTALATGLVFAKFSRPTARVVFMRNIAIGPMNGVPTLAFRIGNERGNRIVDARIRAVLARTENLPEGGVFYRSIELKLQRDSALSLSRSWTVLHTIDEQSPFFGQSPESTIEQGFELRVMVIGLDDISMQVMHADYGYLARHFVWGARPTDVLSERPDGAMVLDLNKFHDLTPTTPSEAFPYPRPEPLSEPQQA